MKICSNRGKLSLKGSTNKKEKRKKTERERERNVKKNGGSTV